jgi:hypothetical protein
MSRTRCAALLFALLLLCTTGCLDYREHMTLKKDGSGTLKIDFVLDLGVLAEISTALGEKPDPAAAQGPTKEEILEGLEVEGIEVKEIDVQQKGYRSKVHLVIAFKNLEALNQIEGFGDDRRIDFYDNGDGKARVVYSFDTKDQLPIEEFGEPGEGAMDPVEKKIVALTTAARGKIKFRSRVTLPGPIVKSTGMADPRKPKPNERVWQIDKEHSPKKHARLGKSKIRMQIVCEKSSVPFVKKFEPLPPQARGKGPKKGEKKGDKPKIGGSKKLGQ